MGSRLASLSTRFPELTWLVVLALTLAAAVGLPDLRSESYLEGALEEADPERARYRELEREFGSDRIALLVLSCTPQSPCESVLDADALQLIRKLDALAASTPGIVEVQSIATTGVLVGDGVGMRAERLPARPEPAEVDHFRSLLLRDPLLLGSLVSRDVETTAILTRFDSSLSDGARNKAARGFLATAQAEAQASGFQLFLAGDIPFATITDGYVRRDLAVLTPLMLAVLAGFLLWVFRSPVPVALALATVAIPTLWIFGLMGWTGQPITPITSMLPILILVVGVTDALHLLIRVYDLRETQEDVRDVVLVVAREVGPPTTITAITAALGFSSLLAGNIPIIRDFGLFAAIGIASGWLLTFSLLPSLLVRLPLPRRATPPSPFALGELVLDAVRRLAHAHPYAVIGMGVLALGVSGYGMGKIVPENDSLKLIGSGDILFESKQFIEARLRPTGTIEVVYEPPEHTSLFEPAVLRRLEQAETVLHADSGEGSVLSVLSILRLANREVVGAELELPETRQGAAQLLLLADLADANATRRYVTPDRKLARISAPYGWRSASQIRSDLNRIRGDLERILGEDGRWFVTGSVFLSAHMGELVLSSQIASFSAAFVTIFLVILIFIRSLPLAGLGLIPNLFPVVVILGFMGLYGINLDVATAMIASIVLGISVDDTMYFLTHYKKARGRGASVRDSVAFTFAVAGKPALFCTVVLALGFFVISFSRFQGLAIFGLLSGFAVILAGLAELLLLPAVLELTAGRAERR